MYLPFFLKIYEIVDPEVTYTHLAHAGIAPFALVYTYEVFSEISKDSSNWSLKQDHFS
jgi:hypothetical protein